MVGAHATPRVVLNTFVEFFVAAGTNRLRLVTRQVGQYEAPFIPASIFYRPILHAMRRDLRLHCSGDHMNQAVDDARPEQLRHFVAIRDGSMRYVRRAARSQSVFLRAEKWDWLQPFVTVRVNPDFILHHPGGPRYAVNVYYKEEPLDRMAADVGIRLMELGGQTLLPGGEVPAMFDARRGRLWTPTTRRRANFDLYLASEAVAYGKLWTDIQQAS